MSVANTIEFLGVNAKITNKKNNILICTRRQEPNPQ